MIEKTRHWILRIHVVFQIILILQWVSDLNWFRGWWEILCLLIQKSTPGPYWGSFQIILFAENVISAHSKPSYLFLWPSFQLSLGSFVIQKQRPPEPLAYIHSKPVNYTNNGGGRDTYISDSAGGLKSIYQPAY